MTAAVAVIDGCEPDPVPLSVLVLVGARLRDLRRRRGWSLEQVEADSGKVIKRAILGAYERGERNIGLNQLGRLAAHYGVPVHELLPDPPAGIDTRLRGDLAEIAIAIDRVLYHAYTETSPEQVAS